MRSKLLSAAGGVVCGVVLMFLLGRLGKNDADSLAVDDTEGAPGLDSSGAPGKHRSRKIPAASGEVADDESDEGTVDAAVAERAQRDAYQARVAKHQASPTRADWSDAAAAKFTEDFTEACGRAFCSVLAVDCRSETCSVEVEWASLATAFDTFSMLLHQRFQENCAVEIMLPEAEDPDQEKPVVATTLLDCSLLLGGKLDENGNYRP